MPLSWYFVLAQKWQKDIVRVCLESGDEGDGGPWGQDVEEGTEVTWLPQLGEEKVRGALMAAYTFLKGILTLF